MCFFSRFNTYTMPLMCHSSCCPNYNPSTLPSSSSSLWSWLLQVLSFRVLCTIYYLTKSTPTQPHNDALHFHQTTENQTNQTKPPSIHPKLLTKTGNRQICTACVPVRPMRKCANIGSSSSSYSPISAAPAAAAAAARREEHVSVDLCC